MPKCRRDPKPGWGEREAPDLVTETKDGSMAIWFRPRNAPKPERYDYAVDHRRLVGWKVYFLLLCLLLIPGWCVVRLVMVLLGDFSSLG